MTRAEAIDLVRWELSKVEHARRDAEAEAARSEQRAVVDPSRDSAAIWILNSQRCAALVVAAVEHAARCRAMLKEFGAKEWAAE